MYWKKTALLHILVVCRLVRFANVLFVRWLPKTVPKGRSGWAKTNFFLHQPSINEPIFSIRFFNFSNQVSKLQFRSLHLQLTMSIRIVADCVALYCQVRRNLKRATDLKFTTVSAIIFIHCYR